MLYHQTTFLSDNICSKWFAGDFKYASGKEEKVSGQWKIPYLAEENADEDPDLLFSTSSETEANMTAKAIILGAGKTVSSFFCSPHTWSPKGAHILISA